ncbi:GNAT family N-acetyltransferase [Neolewinella antarctica]|uniref:GCN5-related N-acetyltransferase Rv2170-like domain-containing protein n=1 Tax=Neolewinella antarctica TaxID=442734 RepID=A0ABX0XGD4_9BACT|nr:GNAT family N-acetyltransferase [Neolewinella antarctica]NJC28375.1 hypothetical protein [Neolewinella antarctica]
MATSKHPVGLYQELPIKLTAHDMFFIHRNLGRPPRWTFPGVITGYGLRCIRLSFENFDQLWPLLAEGDTTYVDEEYRERAGLYETLLHRYGHDVYSGKHGACDWLIVETDKAPKAPTSYDGWAQSGNVRLRDGERLVGVLHLHALSAERLGYGMPNPFVGVQLSDADRGRGLGGRAIGLLEWFVSSTYEEATGVTAHILAGNTRSLRLFEKLGFVESDAYAGRAGEVFLVKEL